MTWSDERVARLKELWAGGHSCSSIAGQLGGLTRCAVIGKIHRLGLSSPETKISRVGLPRKPKKQPDIRRKKRFVFGPRGAHMVLAPDFSYLGAQPAEGFIGLTLLQLKGGQCRYATGGEDDKPFLFCGQPVKEGSSYCPACHARCFVNMRVKYTENRVDSFANFLAGAA